MRITVVVDNIPYGELKGEWGLCLHIDSDGRSCLLDTGGSDLFLTNAGLLGIDVSKVDFAVLSHAHYDHALGMDTFFRTNRSARFFVSSEAGENCYGKKNFFLKRYIGIEPGILNRYRDRIELCSGVREIARGVWTVSHTTANLADIGRKCHLYVRKGWRMVADDFSHEQTLVFDTRGGLVVFGSCSHAGADVTIDEVRSAFPGKEIAAYIGGLHLSKRTPSDVRDIAKRIRSTGIRKVYTGHCTGEESFLILKECLGDTVSQFHTGMVIDLDV